MRTLAAVYNILVFAAISCIAYNTYEGAKAAKIIAVETYHQSEMMASQLLMLMEKEKDHRLYEQHSIRLDEIECRLQLVVAASRAGWAHAHRIMRAGFGIRTGPDACAPPTIESMDLPSSGSPEEAP